MNLYWPPLFCATGTNAKAFDSFAVKSLRCLGWNRQVRNYPNHFWVLRPTCKMFFKIIQQSTSRYVKINPVSASLCFLKWRPFSSQTWEWVTDVTIYFDYFDSDVLGLKVFSSWHLKRCHPKGYTRTVRWVLFLMRAAGDITWMKCMGKRLKKHPIDQGLGLEFQGPKKTSAKTAFRKPLRISSWSLQVCVVAPWLFGSLATGDWFLWAPLPWIFDKCVPRIGGGVEGRNFP